MRDLSRFETVSPIAMLGAQPGQRPKGRVRWFFDDRPARERPTLLRECFARLGGHCDFHALPDAPFHVDLAIHGLPGLVMIAGSLYGSRSRGAREVAAETGDDVALTVGLKGSHHIEQRDRAIVLGEGEAAFTSCADRSIVRHSGRSEMLVLRFPKKRFGPLVDGPDDRMVRRIPSELPALRLLRSYLTTAWDEQVDAGPDVQRSLVTHVYDLMAAMMGATRDAAALAQERGVAAARLSAIKGDIARNLAWSGLTVGALALRHCCTARSIQRLFEQEGTTFTEYLLAQRLARAHELLGDPRRRAEKISTVAFDCGFGDISYFNRAFRRHYGSAPSDVRAQARHDAPASCRRDN